jgi:alkanesulfonate monooxygenase SsuD/methylene tetrahydromethanopterin reductase-like flavin-dependent oxidoreductase (luciferase family)
MHSLAAVPPATRTSPAQVWICADIAQGSTPGSLAHLAHAVEERGFHGLFLVNSHSSGTHQRGGRSEPDGWAELAGLAHATRQLRLGARATAGMLRFPSLLATLVAQIDLRSGGRVEVGVGVDRRTRDRGQPAFVPPGTEGFGRLDEALAILTGRWWTPAGERFTFHGRYHQELNSAAAATRQQPGPPIVIGGPGRRTTAYLAARWGDEINAPYLSINETAILYLSAEGSSERAGRAAAGRQPLRRSVTLTVVCDRDPTTAQLHATRLTERQGHTGRAALVGKPEQILSSLSQYQAIGTSRFYLSLPDPYDRHQLDLIADHLLPGINRAPPINLTPRQLPP